MTDNAEIRNPQQVKIGIVTENLKKLELLYDSFVAEENDQVAVHIAHELVSELRANLNFLVTEFPE